MPDNILHTASHPELAQQLTSKNGLVKDEKEHHHQTRTTPKTFLKLSGHVLAAVHTQFPNHTVVHLAPKSLFDFVQRLERADKN